jgi:hypothetical protein
MAAFLSRSFALAGPLVCSVTLWSGMCGSQPASAVKPAETAVPAAPPSSTSVVLLEDLSGRQLFPPDNWWNQDVSRAPVDPQSDILIGFVGGSKGLHPDFGPPPYGIPYVTVGKDQPRIRIGSFWYEDQSDAGAPGDQPGFPFPDEARTERHFIEGDVAGGGDDGDRHMVIVDRDRWLLYETYATSWNAAKRQWDVGSSAVFNLSTNARRPDGWTSADAGGMAILPGLVRYDEVYGSGPIRHALRFTVRNTNGYVWPASHKAGQTQGAPPLGARFRLKASVDLSGFTPEIRRIFEAMKTYGLILADNGSDMFISGTMDSRWNNNELNPAFKKIHASDFEVIQLGWR